MRKRLMVRSSVWLLLLCMGCAHVRGGGAAASRPVCFSSSEVAFIRGQILKCKGKVARCQMRLKRELQLLRLDHQRDTGLLQSDLTACRKKQQALLKRRCPSCALPWILVGVVGAVAVAAGAWAIYERFTK